MHRKYRRDGTPYPEGEAGLLEWAKDMENPKYKIVKQDRLWNRMWISTVWLGLNHQWGHGKPLIFETMVFGPRFPWKKYTTDYEQDRYSTEAEAIEGHKRYVAMYSSPIFFLRILGHWFDGFGWRIKYKLKGLFRGKV